jgi:hypothetical protein
VSAAGRGAAARHAVQCAPVPGGHRARRRGAHGADGEDPALIERFKTALRGSLGTLGDRIVWAGWRPACVLLGLVVLLATQSARPRCSSFLVVYNLGPPRAALVGPADRPRVRLQVGERLRRAPLANWHDGVVGGAALLLGARALPLVAAGGLTESRAAPPGTGCCCAPRALAAGWRLGRARLPALSCWRRGDRPASSCTSGMSSTCDFERTVVIANKYGLHARPAAEFVKLAARSLRRSWCARMTSR